ncbi:hypothetical protein OA173_06285 [Candidatus Pelagibacter sp.]|nr:hypothetical protein [Candidatus Pelagibacter sp.]
MFEASKYLNNLSWNFNKDKIPYPFIIIDNFLREETYKIVSEKFPDIKLFNFNGDIEANNIGIRIGFSDFSNEMESFWKEFGSYFVNDDFFYNFCELYGEDIKNFYPKIYNRIKKKNLNVGIQGINTFDTCDVLLDFQIGINTPVREVTSVRGPHLDNKKSLYTALCYLKDTDDNTNSGHFTVYKLKKTKLLSLGSSRSVSLSDVIKYKEIDYKSNRVATFLNTKKSIHGVSPREQTNKVRKFFTFNALFKEDLYKIPLSSRLLSRIKKILFN